MDSIYYLDIFQHAAKKLDQKALDAKQLKVAIAYHLESVVLKLYKINWANLSKDPLTATSRIFFSIWITDKAIREQKILYNIHALKMRELKGYKITSIAFAQKFRTNFREHEYTWPNVSTKFGPLTLMEGWKNLQPETLEHDIVLLSTQFMQIDYLIDELLKTYKK